MIAVEDAQPQKYLVQRYNGETEWVKSTDLDAVWRFVVLLRMKTGLGARTTVDDLVRAQVPPAKKVDQAVAELQREVWPSVFPPSPPKPAARGRAGRGRWGSRMTSP